MSTINRVCGIELKGNDAILVVLEDGIVIETQTNKISISDSKDQNSIISFHDNIIRFFTENNITRIGIKERATKGRFSGGSVSFKMEALIQNTDFKVELVHGKTASSKLKNIEIDNSNVKKYQEGALQIAHYLALN